MCTLANQGDAIDRYCASIWAVKHVRLIRHGESAANAGEASLDHATIPHAEGF